MKVLKIPLPLFSCCVFLTACKGQKPFGTEQLTLQQTISLPDIKGRIDHLDVNLKKGIVYIAALGNNSLEIVDVKNGKLLYSIKGLDEPQGVVYIPQTNEIMVANGGDGKCKFYNGNTFENTATIDLGSDADDVRYDSTDKMIYVGYGNGGIAVINALVHQKTVDTKLSGHPEGFQLDKQLDKLFVNVPGANQIELIDLKNATVSAKWSTEYSSNFPMTVDAEDHIIFVGYRRPGKLAAINSLTGKTIATIDLVSDIDDLYYDGPTKKIYASGGGGAINIFLFDNPGLKQIASIATRNGARTSLLIPTLNEFVLAERANGSQPARLQIFATKN